jgi:predicted nucleic acid-binding protein
VYLLDTNIWLERLLDQDRSDEVGRLLNHVSSERLFMTDFTLHSIGVVLDRTKRTEVLLNFVEDAFVHGAVGLIHLEPVDTAKIVQAMEAYRLDFDDAYQYVAAVEYDLEIVSFDSDFDRTDVGGKSPAQIVGA